MLIYSLFLPDGFPLSKVRGTADRETDTLLGTIAVDDIQDIRLTLISRPQFENQDNVAVRVTMQRIVWDKEGRVTEQETIIDDRVYAAFFTKLSKAVFLEQEGV